MNLKIVLALCIVVAALGGFVLLQMSWLDAADLRNKALLRDVNAARAAVDQVEAVNAVQRAHLQRMADEMVTMNADLEEFKQMEGYNAPLSDFLRVIDQRVR